MKLKTGFISLAAASLAVAPVAAQAQSADLSRAAAPVSSEASELGNRNGGTPIWLAVLALAAVVAGVVIALDDEPESP